MSPQPSEKKLVKLNLRVSEAEDVALRDHLKKLRKELGFKITLSEYLRSLVWKDLNRLP